MAAYTFTEIFPNFARGSDSYAIGSDGLLQLFSGNAPRFQYDFASGAFIRGLLVEPATTNANPNPQMAQSPVGTVTGWTNTGGLTNTIAPVGVTGMTGRTGLTRITDPSTTQTSALNRNNVAITPDGSFYVVRISFKKAPLLPGNTAEIAAVNVTMVGAGSAVLVWNPNMTAANAQQSVKITSGVAAAFGAIPEANGLFSVWLAMPDTGATAYNINIRPAQNSSSDTSQTYETLFATTTAAVQAATGNVEIDWVQVEKRSVPYPSSWTLSTRNAETGSDVIGTRFAEFFPVDTGYTLSIAAYAPYFDHLTGSANEGVVFSLTNNTGNDSVRIARSGDQAIIRVTDNGDEQAFFTLGAWPKGTLAKIAVSMQANNIIASVNGNTAVIDTSATLPTPTRLNVGLSNLGAQHFGGDLGYIRFYQDPLDANTVKNLTI